MGNDEEMQARIGLALTLGGNVIIKDFYQRVCKRAEQIMSDTNTLSGAHWNAMKQVMTEMGIEVER